MLVLFESGYAPSKVSARFVFVKHCRLFNQAHDSTTGWSLWYVVGKGDWKYKKDWLQETRTYQTSKGGANGICRRCWAGKPGTHWHDVVFMTNWYENNEEALQTAFGNTIAFLSNNKKISRVCNCFLDSLIEPVHDQTYAHTQCSYLTSLVLGSQGCDNSRVGMCIWRRLIYSTSCGAELREIFPVQCF